MDLDFISACVDEIALEGLDGITIPSLWKRLEKRPKFPFTLDEQSKSYLWKYIACRPEIEFFQLPEARLPLVIFNRYDHFDVEVGIIIEPPNLPPDIYPHKMINEDGIRGSCSTYSTRTNISSQIRSPSFQLLLSLDEVKEKWEDEVVVLVADQDTRMRALIGSEVDPTIEFTDMQYILLERIGRARFHGEVTQGKLSLAVLKESAKNLHYQRKLLLSKNLITKQIHYQRNNNGVTVCGSLLHLTRFYVERKPRYLILLQLLCKILSEKPNKQAPIESLKEVLGLRENFKKVFNKHLYQITSVVTIPMQEAFPDIAPEKCFMGNGRVKTVKALKLLDNVDINKIGKDEDDDEEDDEEMTSENNPNGIVWQPCLDRSYLQQALDHLKQYGPNGAGLRELVSSMGLPKLEIRRIAQNLTKCNAVTPIWKDTGRQRSICYLPKRMVKESAMQQQIREEGLKVLQLTKREVKSLDVDNNDIKLETGMSSQVNEEIEQVDINQGTTGIVEELEKWNQKADFNVDNSHLTYRVLKRINIILQMVHQEQLIENVFNIKKAIVAEENKEGGSVVDRISVLRLIHQLAKEGHIKSFKTVLKFGDRTKKLHFVCHKDVVESSSIVRSAIEQAKMKYFFSPVVKSAKGAENSEGSKEKTKNESAAFPPFEFLTGGHRHYGLESKFTRMQRLHEFFFYLVYDFIGNTSTESYTIWDEQVPKVYKDEISFKRFVPPLPIHADLGDGWCLISDVILRLPVSLFLKLINCTFKISELDYYLKDPIRQFYLVGHLPEEIRIALLYGRRYIFSFCQIAELLAKIGLLSFGPQQYKEKDQKFVYIHKRGSLVDTRITPPSYFQTASDIEYQTKIYEFKTLMDLNEYWYDVRNVCLQTPLGYVGTCKGQAVVIERSDTKPILVAACEPKNVNEIIDDGFIPGDGRGAGGFDSTLFAHLQRNWFYVMSSSTQETKKSFKKESKVAMRKDNDDSIVPGMHYMKYLQRGIEDGNSPKKFKFRSRNKLLLAPTKSKNERKYEVSIQELRTKRQRLLGQKKITATKKTVREKKVNTRIIKEKQKLRIRRPYYDEKDFKALKLQKKLRVDWSAQEDSFLLLCKVTSLLIAPNHYHQLIVSSLCIRDLIHELIPGSTNKTSRACQRRVVYMMRNPQTRYNVSVFVGEAKQDKDLMSKVVVSKASNINEDVRNQEFRNVLMPVIEKFKNLKGNRPFCELPNTIDDLNAKYNLISCDNFIVKESRELEVKNIVDVHFTTLCMLILSSVCAGKDVQKWSFHLYQFYQRYSDSMLRSVCSRLQNDHLISLRKSSRAGATRSRVTGLYQQHINFKNKFLSKYQPIMFDESETFISTLHKKQYNDDEAEFEVLIKSEGGFSAAFIGLLFGNYLNFDIRLPASVISFEKSRGNNKRALNATDDNLSVKKQKVSEEEPVLASTSTNPKPSSKASRVSLYMMRQELNENPADKVQHSQDFFRVNLCSIKCELKSCLLDGEHTPAPNTDHDYMHEMREKTEKLDFLTDQQLVNSIINEHLTLREPRHVDDVVNELRIKQEFSDKQLDEFKSIYDFVLHNGELGTTLKNIKICFSELSSSKDLFDYLRLMRENNLIIQVGTHVRRYVAAVMSKPWTLPLLEVANSQIETDVCSPDETEKKNIFYTKLKLSPENIAKESVNGTYIPRPWIYPDATINKPIFSKILKSVLSQIMVTPGIKYTNLLAKFSPALNAVQALELIEILEKIKCINVMFVRKKRITLFSKEDDAYEFVPNMHANPSEDVMMLTPSENCILILADFVKKIN